MSYLFLRLIDMLGHSKIYEKEYFPFLNILSFSIFESNPSKIWKTFRVNLCFKEFF
jgi:hypothetical protein